MAIGDNIRYYRRKLGISQKELGEKIGGTSQQQIGRWENGDKNPKLETQIKIAAALNVPVSQLNDSLGWLKEPEYKPLEKKLEQIGYTLGYNDDGYLWINYPDGTLEISLEDLAFLEEDTDSYLQYKLDEFKKKNIKNFHAKKKQKK